MGDWVEYPGEEDGKQHTVAGMVKRLPELYSPELDNRRDILVYLPPSYEAGTRAYPVLYMQDGQNLFDRATSFAEEWGIDATLEEASGAGIEVIVVAIPNTGSRCDEYSPFIDRKQGGGLGDHYLNFLLDTLKPIIDGAFRTLPDRVNTGIMGSSMGGLISLYAFFRHPEAFGFVGAMSPALWFAERAIFPYLTLAPFVPGRVYLDVGTLEGSVELLDVAKMRELLVAKGYRRGRELLVVVEKGGRHNEQAWGRRFLRAVSFLLGMTRARGVTLTRPGDSAR